MNFEYIKEHYNVPAEIGRIVTVDGERGIIIRDMGNYIGVNFDSDKAGISKPCHPTWEVVYGGIEKPRKMTRSQKRYQEYLRVSECYDGFKHYLDCMA